VTHVLVPIGGSPQSDAALEHALEEVEPSRITVSNVIDPIEAGYTSRATVPGYSEEWFEQSTAAAEPARRGQTPRKRGAKTSTAPSSGSGVPR
jgi:nucleotide-binding universal stress UspA family protein